MSKLDDIFFRFQSLPEFRSGGQTDERLVLSLEQSLGMELPEEYREFLRNFGWASWSGGGEILGIISDPSLESAVITTTCENATLEERVNYAYPRGAVPSDGVVIAMDGGGGVFVLFGGKGKYAGQVAWYDTEEKVEQWQKFSDFLQSRIDEFWN